MTENKKSTTRREFIAGTAAVVGAAGLANASDKTPQQGTKKARIVQVEHPGATTSATEISGDISDSGAMGTVPWHGTYTATTVEGGFEVSYSESGYVIAGTGSFSASE